MPVLGVSDLVLLLGKERTNPSVLRALPGTASTPEPPGTAPLWTDAPCARQEQLPPQLPSRLPSQPSPAPALLEGTTPWDLLPEQFGVSRVSWIRGDGLELAAGSRVTSSQRWVMPGRAGGAHPSALVPRRAGLLVRWCLMVQRREIPCGCGMLCIKDTAGFKLGQLAGSRIPEILCL